MSDDQLDLELDATGIEDQIAELAVRAQALAGRWLITIDHKTMKPTLTISDDVVTSLLKQAAVVQHLLDKLKRRA